MPDSRALVLAAVIAGLIGTTSRGDVILTLGVNSSGSALAESSSSTNLSSTSGRGLPLFLATTSSARSAPASPADSSHNLAAPQPTALPAAPLAASPANVVMTASAPAAAPASAPASSYDAYINLGTGPFPNAGTLTTGNALPWYDSSQLSRLFGGQPTAQQQAAFDNAVLQRVQQTFQLSGVPVKLTDDPNATAAHTLSVVSNTMNPSLNSAIGMTYLGGNGFHFIDNAAPYARSVDQLEWIVAHNVAHELMLAFGVPENHDQTGKYIDSTIGQMSMFLNPNTTFSSGAIQDLLSRNFQAGNASGLFVGPQLIDPSPVPEPTTWTLWGLGALAAFEARRRGRSQQASA